MKKYELTGETKIWCGHTMHRIRAVDTFGNVKAGRLGGYVEKEGNLSQDGDAWVYDDAQVYGDARVCGNAQVCSPLHLLVIGPCGSRNEFTTFFRNRKREISVKCGCFHGNIDEFLSRVSETHGDNKHALVYRAAAEAAKVHIDLTEDGNSQQ